MRASESPQQSNIISGRLIEVSACSLGLKQQMLISQN